MTKDEALKMVIDNLELQDFNTVNATLIAYCKEALKQPKEPQYLYVWSTEIGIALTEPKDKVLSGYEYIGKIKLESE